MRVLLGTGMTVESVNDIAPAVKFKATNWRGNLSEAFDLGSHGAQAQFHIGEDLDLSELDSSHTMGKSVTCHTLIDHARDHTGGSTSQTGR